MSNDPMRYVSELFAIRLGDAIASVGEGVASAQRALDEGAIRTTLDIYESQGEDGLTLLNSIGYRPSFYGIRNIKSEMKIAMHFSAEETHNAHGPSLALRAMPVNASTTNKYGYSGEASTQLSFEIVPIPPDTEITRVPDIIGISAPDALTAIEEEGLEATLLAANGEPMPDNTDIASLEVEHVEPLVGKPIARGMALKLSLS